MLIIYNRVASREATTTLSPVSQVDSTLYFEELKYDTQVRISGCAYAQADLRHYSHYCIACTRVLSWRILIYIEEIGYCWVGISLAGPFELISLSSTEHYVAGISPVSFRTRRDPSHDVVSSKVIDLYASLRLHAHAIHGDFSRLYIKR